MFISLLCSTLGLSNLFGWCDSNPRHNCSACYSGGSTTSTENVTENTSTQLEDSTTQTVEQTVQNTTQPCTQVYNTTTHTYECQ